LDFRQFRYFLVTAEELHVARAAERLGIAQPALSQMIRAIEERAGARLFLRAHRRIELTAAGRAFLAEARQALEHADKASAAAKRAARGETGAVRIGYVSSALAEEAFLAALASFRQSHPDVVVDLLLRKTSEHIEAMRSEDQDVAVARGPAPGIPDNCEVRLFSRWPLWVAVPARHALAGKRQIALEDLRDETLLLPEDPPGSGLAHTIAQIFARCAFLPRRSIIVSEMTSWMGLVAGGIGVAIMPSSARSLQMTAVAYRPLRGATEVSDLLVVSRRHEQAPAVRAFLECLWRAAPAAKGKKAE
jgi:DNA-binding transcriptional LysR family regulator